MHGAALLRCLTPGLFLLWQRPTVRRLSWSEEAVGMYRALLARGSRLQHRDGLASALMLYANALYLTDRYEEALVASGQCLDVVGARMSRTRTAYLLRVQTLVLAETGRLDEALVKSRECVSAYRDAVPKGRDKSLGSLADALRVQAWVLGRMGRVRESVARYMDCAELLRGMSLWEVMLRAARVKVRMLCEVTSGLRALGRFEEALEAGNDALWWSDTMKPSYYPEILHLRSQLLTDLAWCHAATGDLERAREMSGQAVSLCRTLVRQAPESGEPLLVLALESRAYLGGAPATSPSGSPISKERPDPPQLDDLKELSALCERLAVTDPVVYEPRLASALDELAFRHWQQGANRQAVDATERSVALYRRAAGLDPQEYEPDLARTLANLAIRKRKANILDHTVAHAQESLALTRRLAEADRDRYQAVTAQRLGILARALRSGGDDERALACYYEAETLLRDLMEADSNSHTALLANILTDLADTLLATAVAHLAADRCDDAVTALRQLLDLTRRTDRTAVHAACLTAFAHARDAAPAQIKRAWHAATTDPYPSFIYRVPPS
ncbi:tetratricopeptide repeat protein [Streptomyces sp. NPDC054887]